MPVQDAGIRIEPPPSVPTCSGPRPGRGRRRGAAAGAARGAIEVPGIARDPVEEVVRGADPAEGRRVRLAQHDGAGRFHARHDGRVLGRHVVAVERCPERRAHPFGDHEVLDRERHAVQRPERRAPLAERPLGGPGVAPRLIGRQRHEGVQVRVEPVDAVEHRVHHLDRRDLAAANERGQLGGGQPAEVVGVASGRASSRHGLSYGFRKQREHRIRPLATGGRACRAGRRRTDWSRRRPG